MKAVEADGRLPPRLPKCRKRSPHPVSIKASSSPLQKKTRQLQGYNDDGIDDDDIGSGGGSSKNGYNRRRQ